MLKYGMLNFIPTKEQKEAIEAGAGPQLIIAGAGTGKTFTVTQRILYLIKEKDIQPEEILALTFTEKAAREMKERVDIDLPLGFPEVPIFTFHSFADQFLKEEAIEAGISPDYAVMTESDEVYFLRKILFNLNLNIFRPKGNSTRTVSELIKHVSRLQDENITPEEYLEFVEKNKNKFEEDEYLRFKELAGFFSDYSAEKINANRLSFGDLIAKTYQTIASKASVRKKWQGKYKYVIVDEFQDTNYSQYELIKLLVNGDKNIMVVADDDQSIYKFRGAAVANVLQFGKDYPEAQRIVLNENRRSKQEILDAAYILIQHNNPDRLEVTENISKKLIARNEELPDLGVPVQVEILRNESSEIEMIVQKILQLTKVSVYAPGEQLSFVAEKLKYSDIAILVRANAHMDPIVDAFKKSGIPYQFSGARKLFDKEEVKFLMNFLRVVANYTDDIAMNGILDHNIWGFDERELIEINVISQNAKKSIFEILENFSNLQNPNPKSEIEESQIPKNNNQASLNWETPKFDVAKVQVLIEAIQESWKMIKDKKSVWEILYNFTNKSGFIKQYAEYNQTSETYETGETVRNISLSRSDHLTGQSNGKNVVYDVTSEFEAEIKLKNIAKFFDFIKNFEVQNKKSSIYDFVEYIDLLLEGGNEPRMEESDMGEENAVHLLTVHTSKGLEFPVVFLPSLIRGRFPSNMKSDYLEVPLELVKENIPSKDMHEAEERRLMYVGMTRAKSQLVLSGAEYYGTGKRKSKVSPFLVEIFGEKMILEKLENMPATTSTLESGDDIPQQIVSKKNKKGVQYLSYSQIEDYQTCPRKYRYRYVLKVPSKPSHALSYGISIHNTLKDFYEILRDSNEGLLDRKGELTEDKLLEIFDEKWISAGYENEDVEKDAKAEGRESLLKFFNEFFNISQSPHSIEKKFNLKLGDTILRGTIDRIDRVLDENGEVKYEIIDYKTGSSKSKKKAINTNRQLAIYALAAEKQFGVNAEDLSLLFIDDGEKVTADRVKMQKLKRKVVEEIAETAEQIRIENFDATPGFHCSYCPYNKICKYAQT